MEGLIENVLLRVFLRSRNEQYQAGMHSTRKQTSSIANPFDGV